MLFVGMRSALWMEATDARLVSKRRSSELLKSFMCCPLEFNIDESISVGLICLTAAAMTATGQLILTGTRCPGPVP